MDLQKKKEILDWLNATLDLNVSKVEETASGAIACQLLDVLYPNRIPMSKVHWGAEEPHEFVSNYKLLVSMFAELRIDKTLDVNKMIHCKPKELFDLLVWFKSYYESIGGARPVDYDCLAQRAKGKGGKTYRHSVKTPRTPRSPRTSITPSRRSFSESSPAFFPPGADPLVDAISNELNSSIISQSETAAVVATSSPPVTAVSESLSSSEAPVAAAAEAVAVIASVPVAAVPVVYAPITAEELPPVIAAPSPAKPAGRSTPEGASRTATPDRAARTATPDRAPLTRSSTPDRNRAVTPQSSSQAAPTAASSTDNKTRSSGLPPRSVPRTTKAAENRMAASRSSFSSVGTSAFAGSSSTPSRARTTPTRSSVSSQLPPKSATPVSRPTRSAPPTTQSARDRLAASRAPARGVPSRTAATSRTATTSRPATASRTATSRTAPTGRTATSRGVPSRTGRTPAAPQVDVQALQAELVDVKAQLATEKQQSDIIKEELLGMVKERDFYFDKLRAIEIFIQDYQESGKSNECTASVLRIMYAAQDGFVTADEEALAAVLEQTEQLIGPSARAATAEAENYIKRRASSTGDENGDIGLAAAAAVASMGLLNSPDV